MESTAFDARTNLKKKKSCYFCHPSSSWSGENWISILLQGEREMEKKWKGSKGECVYIRCLLSSYSLLIGRNIKICSIVYLKGEVSAAVGLMVWLRVIEMLNYGLRWSIFNQWCRWLMTRPWHTFIHTLDMLLTPLITILMQSFWKNVPRMYKMPSNYSPIKEEIGGISHQFHRQRFWNDKKSVISVKDLIRFQFENNLGKMEKLQIRSL